MARRLTIPSSAASADSPSSTTVRQMSHGRILGNVVSLYSLQGLNYLLPALILPYLIRELGIEKYGLIAFAQSFAQYFTTFTDYGFNFSATRRIAQSSTDREATSRVFSAVLTVKVFLMLAGILLLAVVLMVFQRFRDDRPVYIIAYLAVVGNVLFPTWLYQGLEEMKYISIATAITKLVSAFALILFVHKPQDYLLALAFQSGGVVIAGLIGLGMAVWRFGIRFYIPTRLELISITRDGWHLFLSTAAVSLYTNTNVFLVGVLGGNIQAGYFSAAEKLVRAMQGLINPVMQAIFPHISLLAKEAPEAALKFIMKTLKWMAGATIMPCLLLLLFAHEVARLCFGPGVEGCENVIRWIAFLPFLIALSNVLGIQTMVTFRMDSAFSKILVIAGAVNIACAVPLILRFGATGAGGAVLLTETFVTACMAIVLIRSGLFAAATEPIIG